MLESELRGRADYMPVLMEGHIPGCLSLDQKYRGGRVSLIGENESSVH